MDGTVVLLALLAVGLIIGIPVSIALLFWRQLKLRREMITLKETHSGQHDAFSRELAALKRQLANLAPATQVAPAGPKEAQQSNLPAAEPVIERPAAPLPVEKPGPVDRPLQPTAPALKPPIATPLASSSVEPRPEVVTPKVPFKKEEPVVVRESQPAVVHPVVPNKPLDLPPPLLPPSSPKPVSPPRPLTSSMDAPRAARISTPPETAPLRASTQKTSAGRRSNSLFAMEENLGRNWFSKFGITLAVIGLAGIGIYTLGQLGPGAKVALSFAVSVGLLAGGIFLEKRERYRVLGHTLIGGGWALLFFTTYAMEHVAAMRVMSSETTDLILMLIAALAMVVHTLRYRSQLVTGLAFLLAYTTVALSHDDVYSLSADVILALGLVSIVLKMGWFELEIFGILSSYLNHLYWLYRLLGPGGAQRHVFPEYHSSVALLLFYWITFRLSYILRKIKSSSDEHMSTTAALLNTLLLLGTMKFQSVQPELAFYALLTIGGIEFAFGQLPITKRRREAFIVLSVLGATLMAVAVPFRYSGNNVTILWLIGAQAFLIAGAMVGEVVFRRLGLCA